MDKHTQDNSKRPSSFSRGGGRFDSEGGRARPQRSNTRQSAKTRTVVVEKKIRRRNASPQDATQTTTIVKPEEGRIAEPSASHYTHTQESGLTQQEEHARFEALEKERIRLEEIKNRPPEEIVPPPPQVPPEENVVGGMAAPPVKTFNVTPETAKVDNSLKPTIKGRKDKKGDTEFEVKKRAANTRRPEHRLVEKRQNRTKAFLVRMVSEGEDVALHTHSLASTRRHLEREKKRLSSQAQEDMKLVREVIIPDHITVKDLAHRMFERVNDIIKLLMNQGILVRQDDTIDGDTAQLVTEEMGHRARRVSESDAEDDVAPPEEAYGEPQPRPPVVTIMGHVDHGKTSLLDAIRHAHVTKGEVGGITQHLGAYQIQRPGRECVTFIDTPGHEAFTAMRARGAHATDIVVLVVAADDGVMPQTKEAIQHVKAAQVPIIVAINKIDKPNIDPQRISEALLSQEIVVEAYGGDVLSVNVSAKTGEGLEALLDAIVLQAELLDLKASVTGPAQGLVLESRLDKGQGTVATLLIQRGTLKVGDILVSGRSWGRVRLLHNEKKEPLKQATPSQPVAIVGLDTPPEAGEKFVVVENEAHARNVVSYRKRLELEQHVAKRISLAQASPFFREEEKLSYLSLVIKADTQGSCEAIVQALQKLNNEEVSVRILASGVGAVSDSDIQLAAASKASVFGFHVRMTPQSRNLASSLGISFRYYDLIYKLIEDVEKELKGMLSPHVEEVVCGRAKILQVFSVSSVGKIAGCIVEEGVIKRDVYARILRDSVVRYNGKLSALKRFKDDARTVQSGMECGLSFDQYQDFAPGDIVEAYERHETQKEFIPSAQENSA